MDRTSHWQRVYTTKAETDVSWFETSPAISLQLIEAAGMTTETCVLDVGGGDSRLVDALLSRGLTCLSVLDISTAALERARTRLGTAGEVPRWIGADVTGNWSIDPVDIWHDRAVFHFLTDAEARRRYIAQVRRAVKPGGHVIVATFGPGGPERCSGLDVVRYDADALHGAFGAPFVKVDSAREVHETPWGSAQEFTYCYCLKLDG